MIKKATRNTLIILAILICFSIYLLIRIYARTPDFSDLAASVQVSIRLANGERSTRRIGPAAPGWVKLQKISYNLIFAIVASEDTTFFSHSGVDLHEIKESIKVDIKRRRLARGASTLTQQVIKNIYLTHKKTFSRKIQEIIWARELEKYLSKQEILTLYLNLVEWGPGIYGAQEAALHYFGIPPSQLSARQSAFLALLLPSPRKYHSYFEKKELSPWAKSRVAQILATMLTLKLINEPTYESALGEDLW